MSLTTAFVPLQTPLGCRWSRLSDIESAAADPLSTPGLWVCLRARSDAHQRPIRGVDCAACSYWERSTRETWPRKGRVRTGHRKCVVARRRAPAAESRAVVALFHGDAADAHRYGGLRHAHFLGPLRSSTVSATWLQRSSLRRRGNPGNAASPFCRFVALQRGWR
jgi:hypothetical protein